MPSLWQPSSPTLAVLLDVLADGLWDELLHQVLEVHGGGLAGDDLHHLLADLAHLAGLGVAGALDLVLALLGEGDAEHAQHVAVGGLHVHVGLDQRLPLADQGAQLVGGEVHALWVGEEGGKGKFSGCVGGVSGGGKVQRVGTDAGSVMVGVQQDVMLCMWYCARGLAAAAGGAAVLCCAVLCWVHQCPDALLPAVIWR